MSTLPGIAYMQALGDGGPRSRTQVVVIHATDETASAHDEASYATRREDETSAHFYVDGSGIYEALQLENVAFGCFPHGNAISVQFELCGRSNQIPDAVMRKAAPYVAQVCAMFGIPVQKINGSQVVAGVKGICGHLDITNAFSSIDGGDHTDPGASFPWGTFISYVNEGDDDVDADTKQKIEQLWDFLIGTTYTTDETKLAGRRVSGGQMIKDIWHYLSVDDATTKTKTYFGRTIEAIKAKLGA